MTKNIAIMDKAYNVLNAHKLPGESFSKVILREMSGEPSSSLMDWVGLIKLKPGEADMMKREILRKRKESTTHTRRKLGLP